MSKDKKWWNEELDAEFMRYQYGNLTDSEREALFVNKLYPALKILAVNITEGSWHEVQNMSRDDLIQHLITFALDVLPKYKTGMGSTLSSFLTLCMERWNYYLWHFESKRKKHEISLDTPLEDSGNSSSIIDLIEIPSEETDVTIFVKEFINYISEWKPKNKTQEEFKKYIFDLMRKKNSDAPSVNQLRSSYRRPKLKMVVGIILSHYESTHEFPPYNAIEIAIPHQKSNCDGSHASYPIAKINKIAKEIMGGKSLSDYEPRVNAGDRRRIYAVINRHFDDKIPNEIKSLMLQDKKR